MNQDPTKRKLTAILSADVVGYSRLMEADEAWTIQSLEENKKLMSSLIEELNGRIVDSPGDNLLAEFSSVINAVECAVKIQNKLNYKNSNLLEERRMHFRIGVNLGDVVEEDGKIYGNGVNIAARLEGLAEPGSICISGTAYDQVKSKIDVDCDYQGEYEVKNINEPVRVYRILMGGGSTEKYVPHGKSQEKLISFKKAIVVFTIILVVAVVTTIAILYPKTIVQPKVVRFSHALPEDIFISSEPSLAVSPDGNQFAYCSNRGLYLRSINEMNARLISTTKDIPTKPVFSPDNKWIAYYSISDNQLKKIPISGGMPLSIADINVYGCVSWSEGSTIIYGYGDTIWRISSSGGNPESLFKIEGGALANPQILPGGNSVIFTNASESEGVKTMVHSLKSGKTKLVISGASARYVKTGHIVYCLDTILYAVPYDIESLEITGGQVSLIDNVMSSEIYTHQYAISDTGTLVYANSISDLDVAKGAKLVWVDQANNEESLTIGPGDYRSVKISPDGKKIALTIRDDSNDDIWIWDLTDELLTRLTFEDGVDDFPLWSVDGKRVIFASDREGTSSVYWKAANGTGSAELLYSLNHGSLFPSSLSEDGSILPLTTAIDGKLGIAAINMNEGRKIEYLIQEEYNVTRPKISPDGRWLAYESFVSGTLQPEMYVSPFPDIKSGKWQISKGLGVLALWSHDGEKLYYSDINNLIAVQVESDTTFHAGKREIVLEKLKWPYFPSFIDYGVWDIHPDGKRFLMIKPVEMADIGSKMRNLKINIVLNWFEELKQKVPSD